MSYVPGVVKNSALSLSMWPGTWARAQRRKAAHIFTVRGPSACRVSLRLTAFHRRPFKTLFAGDFWRFHRGRTTTTDKQRILPLRPVSRISAPLGHPLTIHWRSDRQISNVGVPGASGARRSAEPEGPFGSPPKHAEQRAEGQRHPTVRAQFRRSVARRRAGSDAPARKSSSWKGSDCRAHSLGLSSVTRREAGLWPISTESRRSGDAGPEKSAIRCVQPRDWACALISRSDNPSGADDLIPGSMTPLDHASRRTTSRSPIDVGNVARGWTPTAENTPVSCPDPGRRMHYGI